MSTFNYLDKTYQVDSEGFLLNFEYWDKDFAEGMAPRVGIRDGLTQAHWRVINFIRDNFRDQGKCPLVYETCVSNALSLNDLKRLYPTGYLRGACKLAGITYKQGYFKHSPLAEASLTTPLIEETTYRIDTQGFLVDPQTWDKQFSICKASETKMGKLTGRHWRIINFIRNHYKKNGALPTVYETCEANNLDIENLEKLFPDGYHRGAVKIAGLR